MFQIVVYREPVEDNKDKPGREEKWLLFKYLFIIYIIKYTIRQAYCIVLQDPDQLGLAVSSWSSPIAW
jgi:hypothetical protein